MIKRFIFNFFQRFVNIVFDSIILCYKYWMYFLHTEFVVIAKAIDIHRVLNHGETKHNSVSLKPKSLLLELKAGAKQCE